MPGPPRFRRRISRSKHRVFEAVVQGTARWRKPPSSRPTSAPVRDRTLTSRTRPLTTQDDILRRAVAQYKGKNWKKIGGARHSRRTLLSKARAAFGTDSPPASWSLALADQARAFGVVPTRAEPQARRRARRRRVAATRAHLPSRVRPPRFTRPPPPTPADPRLFKIRPPRSSRVLNGCFGRRPATAGTSASRAREGPRTKEEDAKIIELVGQLRREAVVEDRLRARARERIDVVPQRWYNHLNPDIKREEWSARGGPRADHRAPRVREQVGGDRQDLRRAHGQRHQEPLEQHAQAQGA